LLAREPSERLLLWTRGLHGAFAERSGNLARVGSLKPGGRFRPVGFARRTRWAGPAGQNGAAGRPEARAAAVQRPRRPSGLSTSLLQVGVQSSALGLWSWTSAGWLLGKGPRLGSPWRIHICCQGQPAHVCLAIPGRPRDRTEMELCRDGAVTPRQGQLHPGPAPWNVMSIPSHSLGDLGKVSRSALSSLCMVSRGKRWAWRSAPVLTSRAASASAENQLQTRSGTKADCLGGFANASASRRREGRYKSSCTLKTLHLCLQWFLSTLI
jgi:hypothetical protein